MRQSLLFIERLLHQNISFPRSTSLGYTVRLGRMAGVFRLTYETAAYKPPLHAKLLTDS